MPPKYVIVLESDTSSTTENDLGFSDDTYALVAARRIFMQELVVNEIRPLSLVVGRHAADGRVDWLSTWRAAPQAATVPPQSDPSGGGARTTEEGAPPALKG